MKNLADGPEEPRRLLLLEVLDLGHERDAALQHHGQEDRIGERQVVAGQDGGAVPGHVLEALDPHPVEESQQGGEKDPENPICHRERRLDPGPAPRTA